MENYASRAGVRVDRPAEPWSGRIDGEGFEHLRWHQQVGAGEIAASVADPNFRPVTLLGFASDAGVLRNQGRTGAASGPQALRSALGSLAIHRPRAVHDVGDIVVLGDELESGQTRLAQAVSALLNAGSMPVVLGGGHETAYGSFSGLFDHLRQQPNTRIGILNLDAHFDLRSAPRRSSGTPFKDIANDMQAAGRDFNYAVLGISEPNNTRVLFDQAHALGVRYLMDEQCDSSSLKEVIKFVDEFLDSIDLLYLTIDLDVLPASVAPGVSAPAAYGVPLEIIHAVCRHVVRSGKLGLVDVVELNPSLDIDARTARTAARLINTLMGV